MWRLTFCRFYRLLLAIVIQRPWPGLARYVHRLLVGFVLVLLIAVTQIINRIAYLADDWLFPAYRDVAVRSPVFVVGAPRTGTTSMHRLLALDDAFTTFSTVECLLTPSILQRQFLMFIKRIDRVLGGPLAAITRLIDTRLLCRLDSMHPVSLHSAEEDYFTLLPQLACFFLIIPFPEARWLHKIARLDSDELSQVEKDLLLEDYHRALQRHIFWHSKWRSHSNPCTLLSKNASFAGSVDTLAKRYPDSRFIVCRRDALRAIDSQFRVIGPIQRWLGLNPDDAKFRQDMISTFEYFHQSLDRLVDNAVASVEIPLPLMSRDTHAVLDLVYSCLGRDCPKSVRRHATAMESTETTPSLTPSACPGAPSTDPMIAQRFALWRFAKEERL